MVMSTITYPDLFTCSSSYSHIFLEKSVERRLQKLLDEHDTPFTRKKKRTIESSNSLKKEAIYEAYIYEMKVRWQFKRLLMFWRLHKLNSKAESVIDLITLQEITKPVYIYDKGRRYAFEAKTLSQSISSSLLYQSGSFPHPLEPKNIYTNKIFTYSQLVSVYNQLQTYGFMPWTFNLYRESDFRIQRFLSLNYRILTLKAIKYQLDKTDTEDSIEMVINFIETVSDTIGFELTDRKRDVITAALEVIPEHPIIAGLRCLTYADLESDILTNSSSPFITVAASRLLEQWLVLSFDTKVSLKLENT
jgi:hypothetical protein